jgi:hypothetical protein
MDGPKWLIIKVMLLLNWGGCWLMLDWFKFEVDELLFNTALGYSFPSFLSFVS